MIMTSNYFENFMQARNMLLRGYIIAIIALETGLTKKTIRNLRNTMLEEGRIDQSADRSMRRGQSIIKRLEDREDVSILMLSYRRLVGDSIYYSIDLDMLNEAYDTYVLIKREVNKHPINLLTINDAYSLAIELRSDKAFFEKCDCGCEYFISVRQECSTQCPFCYHSTHSRAYKESSAIY